MGNGQEVAQTTKICMDTQAPSLTERLLSERDQLAARLEEVNSVLHRLDSQPELQATLDAIAKLDFRLY